MNTIQKTVLSDNEVAIWYLGQEGFLFKYKGKFILTDAYLSDYVDRNCKNVKWIRNYPVPVKAEELDFVDYVFITHTHFDHADPDTVAVLAKTNAKFIVPFPETATIKGYGVDGKNVIGAKADEQIKFSEFSVMPVPAAHESFHTDEQNNYKELGYIFDFEGIRIYHAGDCSMYDGLVDRLTNIDIAILPANGRDYFRDKADIIGNFSVEESVILAKIIQADLYIPMHFDLYSVNCITEVAIVDALTRINKNQKYHIFRVLERLIYKK